MKDKSGIRALAGNAIPNEHGDAYQSRRAFHPWFIRVQSYPCSSVFQRFALASLVNAQSTRRRNQPLPPAARRTTPSTGIPGGGSPARGKGIRQADPALRRLLRLPLVPRDGPRVLRGPGSGEGDERALREREGRPRGAPRHRPDLPGRAADAHAARRRLAAHDVPHRRPGAVLRGHVLPEGGALRPAGLRRPHAARARLPRRAARRHRGAERRTGRGPRAHAAARRGAMRRTSPSGRCARPSPSTRARFDRERGGFGAGAQVPAPRRDRGLPSPLREDRRRAARSRWRPRRSRRWPRAASSTSWAAASRATARTTTGPSRTSRRCSTTTASSSASTPTRGRSPASRSSRARSRRRPPG